VKVLLDHNLLRRLRGLLPGHQVKTTREMRWENLKNGVLLAAAAGAGFDAFLSIDKNLRYQQNLSQLPLPVIVLDCASNALPALIPVAPHVCMLLDGLLVRNVYIVAPNGTVDRIGATGAP